MKNVYIILTVYLFLSNSTVRANGTYNNGDKEKITFSPAAYLTGLLLHTTEYFTNEQFNTLPPAVLTRGPYLQVGTQTSIIIRRRTDIAENSRVTWGTVIGTYPNTVDSATSTTEHIVQIS